jgi:hypothetical protein
LNNATSQMDTAHLIFQVWRKIVKMQISDPFHAVRYK